MERQKGLRDGGPLRIYIYRGRGECGGKARHRRRTLSGRERPRSALSTKVENIRAWRAV